MSSLAPSMLSTDLAYYLVRKGVRNDTLILMCYFVFMASFQ